MCSPAGRRHELVVITRTLAQLAPESRERQLPEPQQGVVEIAEREAGALPLFARRPSLLDLDLPIMYERAWPGQAMYRSTSITASACVTPPCSSFAIARSRGQPKAWIPESV